MTDASCCSVTVAPFKKSPRAPRVSGQTPLSALNAWSCSTRAPTLEYSSSSSGEKSVTIFASNMCAWTEKENKVHMSIRLSSVVTRFTVWKILFHHRHDWLFCCIQGALLRCIQRSDVIVIVLVNGILSVLIHISRIYKWNVVESALANM